MVKFCKKYSIECVKVEEGFDYSGFHSYPIINGVLIKAADT